MSHYTEVETQFKDEKCLIDSLCEMKNRHGKQFTREMIKTGANQSLYGYMGDKRAQVADIRIDRGNVGSSSNDLGFKKNENGTYGAIISDFDKSHYGKKWMGELKQTYAVKKTEKLLKKKGYSVTRKKNKDTGVIQIRAKRFY